MTAVAEVQPIATHAPTRPVAVRPEARQNWTGAVTICSIYPAKLRAKRRHNGITTYEIAGAPRGSYSTLTVYDTQDWSVRPGNDGKSTLTAMPIPAGIIATDLANEWSGDTIGARSGYKPGIAVIAGDTPTEAELAAMRESQSNLFNWLIQDAHDLEGQGKRTFITDFHRLATAEMLGDAAEALSWYPKITFREMKKCPSCANQILKDATRCEHCTEKLPQFYLESGYDPDNDPAVLLAINRIRAARAKALEPAKPDSRSAGQPK